MGQYIFDEDEIPLDEDEEQEEDDGMEHIED